MKYKVEIYYKRPAGDFKYHGRFDLAAIPEKGEEIVLPEVEGNTLFIVGNRRFIIEHNPKTPSDVTLYLLPKT